MTAPTPLDELPATFDASATERIWYARWTADGVFTASAERASAHDHFVLLMPPPNVTAVLHMGHGLNHTVQDVLLRWRRMAGDEVLWVPGMDHAGIATQNVVEKQLARDGQTRFDLGREAFEAKTAAFVEETGGVILEQVKAIGASADWSRTAYTLTPELSLAVREAFVRLHEDGLVYRGHRVIHWCPRCGTSLSDEEAPFQEAIGALYHLHYPLADNPSRGITVATTRPETMLGDVAVAVHPDDERYRDLVGQELLLPIANLRIPVVADSYTDPAFGSGAVKITPAHDANDFEVGQRHNLASPEVIDAEGMMRAGADAAGRVPEELAGMDRVAARTRIVAMLADAGVLQKTEQHHHNVRHCYRCDTVVEPRLSDQWFVRMQPLADKALAALRTGRLRILPERWEAVYVNWLEGIRDWNISRQLWWGHRIPVWYCDACGAAPMVSREDVTHCPTCQGAVRQDNDVLDTWFSSWLWPFSTLGWPNMEAPDLKAFYPTDVLVTAPEILFFWVARMVMAGEWFMGEAPFHTVYLHGTVRDMQHRKMSKSLGNGIDPLEVVEQYGADALRWTVISGLGLGVDVMLDPDDLEKSFAPGRNFCTKLWNIGRFLLSRVGETPITPLAELPPEALTAADRWILDRLDLAIADCNAALGPARTPAGGQWDAASRLRGLRLAEYAESARRFVWSELADWYLESVKPRLAESGASRESARTVLAHAFDGALRLLHPIVPFITEALWQRIPLAREGAYCATAAWPVARPESARLPGGDDFALVQQAVSALRQVRAEYNVPPGQLVDAVLLVPPNRLDALTHLAPIASSLGRATFRVSATSPDGAAARSLIRDGVELVVPLAGMVDMEKERQRLEGEADQLEQQLRALEGRLANEKFTAKAPAQVVEAERAKAVEWRSRLSTLRERATEMSA